MSQTLFWLEPRKQWLQCPISIKSTLNASLPGALITWVLISLIFSTPATAIQLPAITLHEVETIALPWSDAIAGAGPTGTSEGFFVWSGGDIRIALLRVGTLLEAQLPDSLVVVGARLAGDGAWEIFDGPSGAIYRVNRENNATRQLEVVHSTGLEGVVSAVPLDSTWAVLALGDDGPRLTWIDPEGNRVSSHKLPEGRAWLSAGAQGAIVTQVEPPFQIWFAPVNSPPEFVAGVRLPTTLEDSTAWQAFPVMQVAEHFLHFVRQTGGIIGHVSVLDQTGKVVRTRPSRAPLVLAAVAGHQVLGIRQGIRNEIVVYSCCSESSDVY